MEKQRDKADEVLHSGETARRLKVSVPTVVDWAKKGILKARRSKDGFWLFDERFVNELAAGRVAAAEGHRGSAALRRRS